MQGAAPPPDVMSGYAYRRHVIICITSAGQCNTGMPCAEAIVTKSCVVEGFVTQEAKNRSQDFVNFVLNFAVVFVPGS